MLFSPWSNEVRTRERRGNVRKTIWTGLFLCILSGTGCLTENKGKGCTLENRINYCLTYNGSESLPEELTYIRERSAKVPPTSPVQRDTIPWVWEGRCFAEAQGPQRVLVMSGDSLVFQSEWITVGSQDGCHADPTTVDIRP
jgi:hypothetical protein